MEGGPSPAGNKGAWVGPDGEAGERPPLGQRSLLLEGAPDGWPLADQDSGSCPALGVLAGTGATRVASEAMDDGMLGSLPGEARVWAFCYSVSVVPAVAFPWSAGTGHPSPPSPLHSPRVCVPGMCTDQAGTDLCCHVSTEFQRQPWSGAARNSVSRNQRWCCTSEGRLGPPWRMGNTGGPTAGCRGCLPHKQGGPGLLGGC